MHNNIATEGLSYWIIIERISEKSVSECSFSYYRSKSQDPSANNHSSINSIFRSSNYILTLPQYVLITTMTLWGIIYVSPDPIMQLLHIYNMLMLENYILNFHMILETYWFSKNKSNLIFLVDSNILRLKYLLIH